MTKIEKIRYRAKKEGYSDDFIGWGACSLMTDDGIELFVNNIQLKLKKENDLFIIREDFPAKIVVMGNGEEKKIHFVKPVNQKTYKLFHDAFNQYFKGVKNANDKSV